MNKSTRNLLAFLYLTVGYFIFSFLLVFVILLLPFAYSGEGISHSEKQGVHQVQFHGSPGLVLLLYATDTGNKNLQYDTTSEAINSSGTDYSRWTSIYWEFFTTAAFALLSIPILKRIFK